MSKHSHHHQKALESGRIRPAQKSKSDNPRKAPRLIPEADQTWVKSMIVYEDADIMGFNKPSGLSSQGGRGGGNNLDDMMWTFVKPSGRRPMLIHRLDRDTSGILLVAKTQPATSYLGKAMIRRAFAKTYLTVVSNPHNLPDKGVMTFLLRREEIGREAYSRICAADHPEAQAAETAFEVLSRTDEAALVRCMPHTGRMHQIRVHLAEMGSPIAGDVRYGGALSLSSVAVSRLMLHALRLTFPHPDGRGKFTLEAPLPEDIAALCRAIELAIPAGA
jgi:tRNA pseudouridine32 synthase/23S rRNA pseudouridine746 synthase